MIKTKTKTLLLPKHSSLKPGHEAGSEAGSQVGSQSGSGFQSGSQSGTQSGSQAGSEVATHDALNECVSTSEACRWLRMAEVCLLPAVYSPIVPWADVYKLTMDDYRLCIVQGSMESLL